MLPIREQNGLPEPDPGGRDDPYVEPGLPPSREVWIAPIAIVPVVPVQLQPFVPPPAPAPREHRRAGSFRFGARRELQPDPARFGERSHLTAPPATAPVGTGFVEWDFGGDRPGATNGLGYHYYEGDWTRLPRFESLRPVAEGASDGFDLAPRRREDFFGFVFFGDVEITADGTWTFYTRSDDGSRLWIDGRLVVDNDGLHGAQERSGSLALARGRHAIAVGCFERTGAAVLEVSYEGPGVAKQRIPRARLFRGDALYAESRDTALLATTPGRFRLFGGPHRRQLFFYEDARRAFLAEPRGASTTLAAQLAADRTYVSSVTAIRPRGILAAAPQWQFRPFYHPYADVFANELARGGVASLYRRDLQASPDDLVPPARVLRFQSEYGPSASVHPDLPSEELEFSAGGAYASYNWELFFHAPMLVAQRLSEQQRFAEAQRWFHFVFDPTDRSSPDAGPQRFWPFEGFRSVEQRSIERLLQLLAGDDAAAREVSAQVKRWREHPFDPHVIAELRTNAYQMSVVMRYVDNLIAWGDQLFRRDTLESINEATLLYVLAGDLLGPRPEVLARHEANPARTFTELGTDSQDDFLVGLENAVDIGRSATTPEEGEPITAPYYFCVPQNDQLLAYWDTVADRLFKIRHGMNIEGVERQLALFEPPIDPGLLVRAAAAGVDLASVLSDASVARLPYRFRSALQTAKELCGDVKALGASLLSALEKRDAEDLALLRSGHELALLDAMRAVKKAQVEEATRTREGLERSRESAELRWTFYRDVAKLNENEKLQLSSMSTAFVFQQIAQAISAAAAAGALVPNFDVGISGWAGSPVAKASFGGAQIGGALQATAGAVSFVGAFFSQRATVAGILGGYDRRWDDWKLQERLARKEMDQLERQILAAQLREAIAEKELENHDLQAENAREAQAFMRTKFTNGELYDWMVSQLSALYFQGYQLAYDVAKRAQRAYQFELGRDDAFVQFGYWDGLKKGLLAGERLEHDLKRLEVAYLENDRREHEITKHVSLALHDPAALLALRTTGECFVELPEELFDRDFPGHYMRRLRTVSLSIPGVVGPYTSVNATLTLLWNSARRDPALRDGRYARARGPEGEVLDDPRFADGAGAIQSIVTSTGREDAGVFEQNLRDERYLPFEGAGAVSRWRIQLPPETNAIDLGTVADAVLHLRYTARDGGEALRRAAWEAVVAAVPREGARLFLADQEFPDAWYRFRNPAPGQPAALALELGAGRLPFLPEGWTRTITRLDFFARVGGAAPAIAGRIVAPDGSEHAFAWAAGEAMRSATLELPGAGAAPGAFRLELDGGAAAPQELAVICAFQSRPAA